MCKDLFRSTRLLTISFALFENDSYKFNTLHWHSNSHSEPGSEPRTSQGQSLQLAPRYPGAQWSHRGPSNPGLHSQIFGFVSSKPQMPNYKKLI